MKRSVIATIFILGSSLLVASTQLPSIMQLSRPGSYTLEARTATYDPAFINIDQLTAHMGNNLWNRAAGIFKQNEKAVSSAIATKLCSMAQEPIFTVIAAQGISFAFALFNPYACTQTLALTKQKFSGSLQMLAQAGAISALGEEIGRNIYGITKNKKPSNTQQIFTFTKDDAEYGIAAKLTPILVQGSIVGFCIVSWWFDIGSGISPQIPQLAINIASSIGLEAMMDLIPESAKIQKEQKAQNTQLVPSSSLAKDLFVGVLSTGVMATSLYMLPEQHLLLGQQSTILGATTLGMAVTLAAPMLDAYVYQHAYESTKNLCSIASSWFKGIGNAVWNSCSALDNALGTWLIEHHGQ